MRAVLIDTNAFTALLRGDPDVLKAIDHADCVYASVIVIGELEAGFRGGSRYSANIEILERFLTKQPVEILPVTRDTSDAFGRIKNTLRQKGTPIPINDVWIGAQCIETGAHLLTYDRHFSQIDGLRIW